MPAGVLAFFEMLPRLISIIDRLGNWIETNDGAKWISNLEKETDNLENAKTDKETFAALHGLLSSIRTIK